MAAINDITGDSISTKVSSDAYRNNFDAIFRKPKQETEQAVEQPVIEQPAEPTKEELEAIQRNIDTARWHAYIEQNQKTLTEVIKFSVFRETILPTLGPKEYMKFVKE